MAIEYKAKRNTNTSEGKNEIGFQIIFFALNFLAVPFSAYATYNGYKEAMGGDKIDGEIMAIILALITALLFFGLNYIIMDRRKRGLPHKKQILGYLFPLAISFFGNFAFFYGNSIEASSLKNVLADYSKTFDATYRSSMIGLDESTGLEEFKAQLDEKLGSLEQQASQLKWGPECDKEWAAIKAFCGGKLTKMIGKKTFAKANKIVLKHYKTVENTKNNEINKVKTPIEDIYKPLHLMSDSLLKDENVQILKDKGEDLVNDIKRANNQIADLVVGKIPDFKHRELETFEAANSSNTTEAIEHAWKNKLSSIAPGKSLFFSLIIDLVTLGFIFLAISYTPNTRKKIRKPRTL